MENPLYIDVSLPVPVDQAFTYALPETLRHRVRAGCRVLAPFGVRKLTGIILRCHSDEPSGAAARGHAATRPGAGAGRRHARARALDRVVLLRAARRSAAHDDALERRGPSGLRSTPSPMRAATCCGSWCSTPRRKTTRCRYMRMLESRSLLVGFHRQEGTRCGRRSSVAAERKGFVRLEEVQKDRDPLRAPSARLRVELIADRPRSGKLRACHKKAERELRRLPGTPPRLAQPQGCRGSGQERQPCGAGAGAEEPGDASPRAARRSTLPPARPSTRLNTHQQRRFDADPRAPSRRAQFQPFLLHGVTGSGKTEVYLQAIDAALALGRGALMLVPEIALTPAMAGQFFHALRRPRGHPALGLQRHRTRRAVAAHPLGRGAAWWSARGPACSRRCATSA